ncbi:23S rRNA (pseudouridine(1915)-N(3))-methyltransferase RlmH [Chitiniphilus purpureus]|uniref:Ribosomal RNA large subunit methyltransferase H n=1 Tax=Chitiniphilus purpureus TaxID=2981137 RepID=A0ABY6DQC2_9NEIS|nr:23S rRNA (pseudouridine(1915)-N(3))-methyltransferase RlmH [Chitiniphilus sp. CD1]UXY15686.1 23S rRNA (pseudouridine(1915)-N(3))-methyltransferase RlmH [Chitiniphilus sp. CD1]
MRLIVIAVGHRMPAWIEAGFAEYSKRLPREFALTLIELKPDKRSGGRTAQQVMAEEAVRILAAIPQQARVLALDERGANWSTARLADAMKQWHADGRDTVFIIGGADGLDPSVKQRADQLLQLSALTLPHGLVRVLLAEQLYRAYSILHHHPYHRE